MAKGLAHRLYSGEVSYDFVGNRKRWYTFSAILMTVFVVVIAVLGLNLSIDFKGGTEFTVPTRVTSTTADDYRVAVAQLGLPKNDDITVNSIGTEQVRIQMRSLTAEEITTVRQMLAQKAGIDQDDVTHSLIGASWGKQITKKGITALVVFMLLVSALIWAYFREKKMAVAAIVALMHDLVATIGLYALIGFSFSPASLIGLLSILGYSLYDTVVVFDKVRENTRDIARQRRSYGEAANLAINQVLVRSLNTTIIAVLPVGALLFAGQFILGTGPLKDLGLVLFAGMIFGAYSSIFIATPLLVDMKNREPELVEHHERLARRETRAKQRKSEPAAVKTVEDIVETEAASVGVLTRDEYRQLRQQPTRKSRSERKK
jgi:preprotein translocase subunit SecF